MSQMAAIRHSGSLRLRWRCRKETNCGGLGESALPLGCESGGELEITRTIGDDGFFCINKDNFAPSIIIGAKMI